MKKLITILLIFILMVCCLAFVACEDDKVSNKPQYITVSFHSTNIECTLPEAQTYNVGDKIELSLFPTLIIFPRDILLLGLLTRTQTHRLT